MGVLPKPKELNKKNDSSAIVQGKERVRLLAGEETRLVRTINDLRAEIKTLEERLVEVKVENQPRLIVRKSILEKEVETLEARRRDAIKPVDLKLEEIAIREAGISKTAQEALAVSDKNVIESRRLEAKEKEVRSIETQATAMLHVAEERVEEAQKLEDELREHIGLVATESATKAGELDDRERGLEREKQRLEERNKALNVREDQLDKEKKRLENEDRRIKDGYHNLELARKEILGK